MTLTPLDCVVAVTLVVIGWRFIASIQALRTADCSAIDGFMSLCVTAIWLLVLLVAWTGFLIGSI